MHSAKKILKLPHVLNDLEKKTEELHQQFLSLNHQVAAHTDLIGQLGHKQYEAQEEILHRLQVMDDRITDLLHQLSVVQEQATAVSTKKDGQAISNSTSDLVADDHLLDNLYVEFERWCRGNEVEIKKRQEVYLPYFKKSKLDSKKLPVLDIGCGRGEFVELLTENGIRAIGMDLNKAMVERLKEKGIEGVQADALSYLREQKAGSLMAITGFHLVEHIPFKDLVRIFNECYRVLAPGGFVIFETPNPENVIVGSYSFYMDPSHLHPLPPPLLELTLKTRGFPTTEIKRLHPIKKYTAHKDPLVQEMAERMFGPQDYAVIATK